ncbi:hypothetical protein CGRA01v4_00186 [Colletotrichum graminicola]|nr:hypothetical protein CGRA01v4_00186 [Colletotrichum graminicola]
MSHQTPLGLGNDTRPPMKVVSGSKSTRSGVASVSPPTMPRPRLFFFALLSTEYWPLF